MKNFPNYTEYLWEGDVKILYYWPEYVDTEVHDKDETKK